MKSSLVFVALLLVASSAQAQHSRTPSTENGGGLGQGYGYGGWGSGSGLSSNFGSAGHRVAHENPRNFTIGYAQNDGPFVPSVYMKYEDALELGRQQLAAAEKAAQGDPAQSLGEIARSYRTAKVPTLKLQAHVLQDNSGRLTVCNLNGNDCHRP